MELPEDRVYARHRRHRGAVLIIGAGSIGGLLAVELARMGISPLRMIDPDILEVENLVRHPLGATALNRSKSVSLARLIRRDFPLCDAWGDDNDFLKLGESRQLELVRQANVVVAATDSVPCQRRINEVALDASVPAVYPSVWTQTGNDGEIGEIFWVRGGRGRGPCYRCATEWRPDGESNPEGPRGGMRVDYLVLVSATASVIAAILDPYSERAQILDPERTMMVVHGFMPFRPEVRGYFHESAFNYARIPFPRMHRCRACGGQETDATLTQTTGSHLSLPTNGQPIIRSFYIRRTTGKLQVTASVVALANSNTRTIPFVYVYEWGEPRRRGARRPVSPEASSSWNTTHTYTQAGTYTVTVSVANLYGHDTATNTITVDDED